MPPPTSDNTQYYEILGVSKDVSEEDLRGAWRRKAKEHHPDKGGDPKKFHSLRQAFDVLKDSHKRRIYDQCIGHALPGSCDLSNLPIGCGNRRRRRLKLGKDVRHLVRVSHEELQNGTTKLFFLSHNVICSTCKGKGSKSGASVLVPCANCGGSGMKVLIEQHWRKILCCSECMGAGQTIGASDKCPTCRGDSVVQEKKVLEVHVEKGMKDGQRITFPEDANEAPGFITGDVVFVLCLCDPEDPESSDFEVVSEEDSEEVIFVSKEDPEVDGEEPSTDHQEEEKRVMKTTISDEDPKQDFEE